MFVGKSTPDMGEEYVEYVETARISEGQGKASGYQFLSWLMMSRVSRSNKHRSYELSVPTASA